MVVVAGFGLCSEPAGAQAGGSGEFDDARQRANAVAAELADAQSRLAGVEAEMAGLEAQAADGQARQAALEQSVRELAVDRFMRGSAPSIALLATDLNAAVRADALAGFVTRGNVDAVDEYRQAGQDVTLARQGLAAKRADLEAAAVDVEERVQAAENELARLQRRDDERRAAQAEAEAQTAAQRRAAEAGSRPGVDAPTSPPSRSPSPASPVPVEWTCPVQGPLAFSNDWGQPRSGGRRHQGNDILSPRGTPVVASVSGSVRPHTSGLGGISYYLKGDDGNTYFGTHLDSLSGASGAVDQGDVLGYVGNSGNASGGPTHLHFEVHPGGGGPVNPYPTLSQHC